MEGNEKATDEQKEKGIRVAPDRLYSLRSRTNSSYFYQFSSGGSGSGRSRWRDRGPLSSGGGSSSSRAGGGKGKKKEQVATLYEEDLWDESTPRGKAHI